MKKLLWIIFILFCIQNLNAQNNIFVQKDSAISIHYKDFETPIKAVNHQEIHSKINATSYPKNDHIESYPKITIAKIIEQQYSADEFPTNQKFAAYFEKKDLGKVDISYAPDFVFKDRSTLNLKYLDKSHGFFSNFINNIQQDKDGVIWLSSNSDGVGRLDGKEMIVYTDKSGLPTSNIKYIFYDSNDRLWIGSLNGICYISNQKLYIPKFDFLDSTSVLYITEDRNNDIWFGTDGGGAFHYKNDSIIQHNTQSGLPGDVVKTIIQDKDDNYWFGFYEKGFCKFDGHTYTSYTTLQKNKNTCQIIEEDVNGIWFGFFSNPILFYDGKSFKEYQFLKNKNLCINSILLDKDRVWFVEYGKGLIEYYKGKVKTITEHDGLTNQYSYRGFIDHNKNIWVAHFFGGISRLDDTRFTILNTQNKALFRDPLSLHLEANGDIWYLQNGIHLLKEKKDRYIVYSDSDLSENEKRLAYVYDMEPHENDSYFFTMLLHGICLTDLKTSIYYTFDNADEILKVEKGINGSYWFMSTNAGLFKYSAGRFYNLNKANGLLSNKISNIHTDKSGQLWIAHVFGGLNIINDNKIATLHEEDGLSSSSINCFFDDDKDGLWLGTSYGIDIIYPDKTIHINNGLISNEIRSITKDSLGYYWVGTSEGLSRINWIDEDHIQIENYDRNDGINITDFHSAVVSLKDGQVLWGNSSNIISYNPDENRISHRNVSIKFDEKCFTDSITENYEIKNNKVEIQPNGQFNISFTSIDWGNEANITYQYSIISKEMDTVWNDLGQGSKYLLKDIENGDYQFLAKATIKGFETETIALNFEMLPFWWKTKEFAFILIILFLLSGPLIFYRYSKKKNREKEKLEVLVKEKTSELIKENIIKDALVQEIHHRVKNNLQSISSLVDMQLRTLNDDSKRKVLIDTQLRIGAMALVHEMLYSNDNFSQVSVKDYLNSLVFSINEMVNPKKLPIEFNIKTINYNLNISDCISFGILTSEVISNSIKYAFEHVEKPKIDINFSIEDNVINYSIEDNGNGLKDSAIKKTGSLGMRLINVFSRQLKAKLSIENNPGVLVKLKIPLKD